MAANGQPNEEAKSKLNADIARYTNERKVIQDRVKELTEMFRDIHDLAIQQHELYGYRQDLVSKKQEVMSYSNIMNRTANNQRRMTHDSYKTGKPVNAAAQMQPKNDFERELYLKDDMRNVEIHLKIVADFLEFILDSIKTIDNMIYGVDYAIKLQAFVTPVK